MRRSVLPALRPETPRRLVLAASTGGHLAQLVRLAPGLGASDDSLWITFRTPQSESLLAGRDVLHVPYIRPRDLRSVCTAFAAIRPRLAGQGFAAAVSTGAALALAALPAARSAGVPTLYVESVSRMEGPSVSGRVIAGLRLGEIRTQHPSWARGRWGLHPSVLSTYRSAARATPCPGAPRLFVTLGTIRGYGFPALVDRIVDLGLAGPDTVWQLGDTRVSRDLPGTVHREMSAEQFERAALDADCVVTHAGVGTVLGLLEHGISPVVVPRRRHRGEHVDDHQRQLVALLRQAGVGCPVELEELRRDTVVQAVTSEVSLAA
ncbi:glycosyltransferase [Geodermatophilus sp. FMUSA9-8]|uniref:glycosyltransferase n=1 Tax=Geodermatophilus sp. FMUSA9-8 TaxID=3120155 RepID=UPI0030098D85